MKRKQLYLLSLAFIGLMGRVNAQCASPGWDPVGPNDSTNRISFGESEYEAIAIDPTTNTPYVAYRDGNNFYGTSVVKYVGGKWQQVGSTAFTYIGSSSEVYDNAITVDKHGTPYVACEDKGVSNHCAVFKFNGTTWDTLPGQKAGFNIPCQFISITTDTNGVPYVAYEDLGTTKVDVLMFNGSAWVPVGGLGVSKGQAQYVQIAMDRVHNIPYLAYEDGKHSDKLMVEYYKAGAWTAAADTAGLTTDTVNWVSMTTDKSGNVYVAYEDFSDAKNIGMMTWNGTSWTTDTTQRNKYLGGPVNYVSIGADASGNVYAAYEDLSYYGYSGLSIAEYSGGAWDFVGKSYKVSQSISAKVANFVSLAVDGTGIPYLAYEDKGVGNHAMAFMYNSTNKAWQLMATQGLSNGSGSGHNGLAAYTSIATSPIGSLNPYIAYSDVNNSSKATVMTYSSGAWSVVGTPGISLGTAKFTNMGVDAAGEPICLFADGGATPKYSVSAMKYSGSAWAALGTNALAISGANAYYVSMAIANDTVYSAFEMANYHMRVIKCGVNGTLWDTVGGGDVNGDSAAYESVAVDKSGNVYVAFQDNGSNQLGISVMEYIAGSWKYLGARNISGGQAVYPSIQIDPATNMPVVAYSSYGAGTEANVVKWNGTTWVWVGAPGFSNDWTSYMSLTINQTSGVYYVAYSDWGNEVKNQGQEDCTVEKFDPKTDTAWVFYPVGGSVSQDGATYESSTVDANGNVYVAYASYGAFVKELTCDEGINEIGGNKNVQASVYPNPSHGSFTVALQNAPAKSYVNVYNVLGENIYQAKLTSDKTQINLNSQPVGMYLYRIFDETGKVISTGKLIIQ
jgi:hypothetical protein